MRVKCPVCGAMYIYGEEILKKFHGKPTCFKCKTQFTITESGEAVPLEEKEKAEAGEHDFIKMLSDAGRERMRRFLTDPSFKEHVPLAEELLRVNAYPQAEEIVKKILEANPRSLVGKALRVRVLLARGERKEAEEIAKEIEKFYEGNPLVMLALAEFYTETEPSRAHKYLTLYLEERPDDEYARGLEERLREVSGQEMEEKGEELLESREEERGEPLEGGPMEEGLKEEVIAAEFPVEPSIGEEEFTGTDVSEAVSADDELSEAAEPVAEEVAVSEEEIIKDTEFEVESGVPEEVSIERNEDFVSREEEGVPDEADFSSIMKEAEAEEIPAEEEEGEDLLEELALDETELVSQIELPEIGEEKKKKGVLPYIIGGISLGIIILAASVSFYIMRFELGGDVKKAGPSKILALSKGFLNLTHNTSLSKESFEKGMDFLLMGKEEEALHSFKLSAFYNAKSPDALSLFACMLAREGKEKADVVRAVLLRAESLGGGSYVEIGRGCIDLVNGRYDETFKRLSALLTAHPHLPAGYYFLIESFERLQFKPEEEFRKVIEGIPFGGKEAALLYWKTAEIYRRKNPDLAKRYFTLSLEKWNAPEIKISFAKFLLEETGDYLSSRELLAGIEGEKGVSRETLSSVYVLLGRSYFLSGDLEKASEYFTKATELNPDDLSPVYEAVKILLSKNKFEEARKLLLEKASKKAGLSPDYYYLMGRCDFGQRRYFSAAENFKKAVSLKKEDEFILALSEAYLFSGGVQPAEETLREFTGRNPDDIRGQVLMVRIYVEKGEIEEGRKLSEKIIQNFPEKGGGYYARAIVMKALNRYPEAESDIKKAISIEPSPAYALFAAEVSMAMKKYEEVIRFASVAISSNPQDPRGYILRAGAYEVRGELEKALSDYTRALTYNPVDLETALHLIDLLIFLKRYDEALRAVEEAMGVSPNDYRLYYRMGNIYYQKGDVEKAAVYMARVIDLKSDFAGAHYFLGIIYEERGVLNKAEEELALAVKYEDKNPRYLFALGRVLFKEKKAFDALEKIEKAIIYSPGYVEAWVVKGKIKAFLGAYGEAKECFRKAIELDRKFVEGWIGLANVATAEGDRKSAHYYLDTAERINPSVDVLIARGKLLHEEGNLDRALKYFERAIAGFPSHPAPYFYAGLIYKKMGFTERAREMFEKAVKYGLSGEERAQLNREISNW